MVFPVLNPFGEDEDDFDVDAMIDGNLKMAYLIVDDMHNEHPDILKDKFWKEGPTDLSAGGVSKPSGMKISLTMIRNPIDTRNIPDRV